MIVTFELPGDKLPEHCYDCPIHDGEDGHCQLDGRTSVDWRPFWCPLRPASDLVAAPVSSYEEPVCGIIEFREGV